MSREKPIVLLMCSKHKRSFVCPANEMYISERFQQSLKLARLITDNDDRRILILSAKHNVLQLNDEIEPYNIDLAKMKPKTQINWGRKTAKMLSDWGDLDDNAFLLLTNSTYHNAIISHLNHYTSYLNMLEESYHADYLNKYISSFKMPLPKPIMKDGNMVNMNRPNDIIIQYT